MIFERQPSNYRHYYIFFFTEMNLFTVGHIIYDTYNEKKSLDLRHEPSFFIFQFE